jgi:hypothetical protein
MNHWLPLAAATIAWTMASTSASADPPVAANVAQVLFEQAREEMKRGAYEEACPKLAESQRLDPSSGTLLNLVLCEEGMGKVATAWLHARELLDVLPAGDVRRPIAERKLAQLSPRVPKLTVRLSSTAPPGTRVALDGVDLGPAGLGVPVPVDPGPHRATVTALVRSERSEAISLKEGQQIEWVLQPSPEGPGPEPPDARQEATAPLPRGLAPAKLPVPRPPARPSNWGRWAAFGVGAAGLVAGGVLGALALDRRSTVLANCPDKQCRDPSGLDAAQQGQALLVGSVCALGVGVAGAGLGAYLVLRGDSGAAAGAALKSSSVPRGVVVTYSFDL